MVMQIHRWIGREESLKADVADWVVADRVLATKGDFVGQWAQTKLPYFSPTDGDFTLDGNPKPKDKQLASYVELNFGTEPSVSPFLVDFDGGKTTYVRETAKDGKPRKDEITDNAPVEVLMLSPDGRLIARDSATDENDKDRVAHRNAWVHRIRQIDEEGKVVPTAGGAGGQTPPGGGTGGGGTSGGGGSN